jgi:hypothetical protein
VHFQTPTQPLLVSVISLVQVLHFSYSLTQDRPMATLTCFVAFFFNNNISFSVLIPFVCSFARHPPIDCKLINKHSTRTAASVIVDPLIQAIYFD